MTRGRWMRWSAVALVTGVLGACGGSDSSSSTTVATTAAPSTAATTATTAAGAATASSIAAKGAGSDAGTDASATSGDTTTTAAPAPGARVGNGFDPAVNGFSFENYTNNGVTNLTPPDVQRMFGDGVCASGTGPSCTLSPPAKAWMESANGAMNGGHCEGMAVVSLLMQQGKLNPQDFGGATASALSFPGNEKLQREIAYWFITQALQPTKQGTVKMTPKDVVDKLRAWYAGDTSSGGYTLGIYKRDGTAGHAITPVGVEDRGDGKVDILVYDNNYPNQTRRIAVDLSANTWLYSTSTNPAEAAGRYDGDATTNNLELTSNVARLAPQACPFCGTAAGGDAAKGAKGAVAGGAMTQVFLSSAAFDGGVTVTVRAPGGGAIAGLSEWRPRGGGDLATDDEPPVLQIPAGVPFEVVLDASAAKAAVTTDLTVVGPGFDGGVDAIKMAPGQRDTLLVDPAKAVLRYTTTADESPTVFLGIDDEPDAYSFSLGGVELGAGGGTLEARLDLANRRLVARTTGSDTPTLVFALDKINDAAGDQHFENDGVKLQPNESLVVEYGAWKGDKTALSAGLDTNGDDVIDQPFTIDDQK